MAKSETELIERAFQELINTKHLYQSIEIDFEPIVRARAAEAYVRSRRQIPGTIDIGPERRGSQKQITEEFLNELDQIDWVFVVNKVNKPQPPLPARRAVSLLPVKTLCAVCDDVTSFNLWLNESVEAQAMSLGGKGKQTFCLPLQCQGCRANVIVFMVARIGRKIQLVGRSEFEEVKVPAYIPKNLKRFYSQGVIAFNCGQILAALFLLRTLVEQHMRAVTGSSELRGEDLCEEYDKRLDQDFKDRFASFKEIYANLSQALHRAEADGSMFELEICRVRLHFEGLEIFARAPRTKKR